MKLLYRLITRWDFKAFICYHFDDYCLLWSQFSLIRNECTQENSQICSIYTNIFVILYIYYIYIYIRGGQLAARGPHAALIVTQCGPRPISEYMTFIRDIIREYVTFIFSCLAVFVVTKSFIFSHFCGDRSDYF